MNSILKPTVQQRKTANEKQFMEDMKDELPVFGQIITMAFEKMQSQRATMKPNEMNRNWLSNSVNGFIKGLVEDRYLNEVKRKNGTFYLHKDRKYILYFKKFDSKKLPAFKETKSSKLLCKNQTLFPEYESEPIIFIGYRVDRFWSKITGMYAVSITSSNLNWVVDIPDNLSTNAIQFSPTNDADVESEPLVKLKTPMIKVS